MKNIYVSMQNTANISSKKNPKNLYIYQSRFTLISYNVLLKSSSLFLSGPVVFLQESLDEVTIKDTLEGDNMYTCSQCGKKVRAEKRSE